MQIFILYIFIDATKDGYYDQPFFGAEYSFNKQRYRLLSFKNSASLVSSFLEIKDISINPFHAAGLSFYSHWKHQKTSAGIERDQQHEIGYETEQFHDTGVFLLPLKRDDQKFSAFREYRERDQ